MKSNNLRISVGMLAAVFLFLPMLAFAASTNSQDSQNTDGNSVGAMPLPNQNMDSDAASTTVAGDVSQNTPPKKNEILFRATVMKILKESTNSASDGVNIKQQNLELKGQEGQFKNKIFQFNGIGDVSLPTEILYQPGDKVIVEASFDDQGKINYYITDYDRTASLWYLLIIFIVILFAIGRFKGLRALLALAGSFMVMMYFIVPRIVAGANAVTITFFGSVIILLFIIYLSEGFNKRSHLAVLSIFFSLIITIAFSWIFVKIAHLSGISNEEASILVSIGSQKFNLKGLLLSGIIIGTLGVLDDMVISQISAVEQLHESNPLMSPKELYRKAYEVGRSHFSSMTNTLFLAYAGAALPLLIVFSGGMAAQASWVHIINGEDIATEIIRTLTGSIGLILAVPISTWLAVWGYKNRKTA